MKVGARSVRPTWSVCSTVCSPSTPSRSSRRDWHSRSTAVMNNPGNGVEPSAKVSGLFATTHWSVVLAAGHGTDTRATEALERLCGAYWRPLYLFVRSSGYDEETAKDLTQAFFERLLEKDFVKEADPTRGR